MSDAYQLRKRGTSQHAQLFFTLGCPTAMQGKLGDAGAHRRIAGEAGEAGVEENSL